jgi:hypothetical protein
MLWQDAVQSSTTSFVSYTMALLSGVGNTVLYALLLTFDSVIAIFMGMAWGIQNIMYAFNPSACRVSDYMQKVVLQCACNDAHYRIPLPQRSQTWRDGALWCTGALSMPLLDGSTGVIYNPYSLDELSAGLKGITTYIRCLSMAVSATNRDQVCPPPPAMQARLEVLISQNVQPIAVWTKCKSNYLLQTWDPGAGALFSDDLFPSGLSDLVVAQRSSAREWAFKHSPDLLACLASPARFNLDYSTCLTLYLNLTTQRLPNAYFLYSPSFTPVTNTSEPPDACLVFSGLNASASSTGGVTKRVQTVLQECMLDSSQGKPSLCPFNPSIWSARSPANTPVAKLFGTTSADTSVIRGRYTTLQDQMHKAFLEFNRTFRSTAQRMKIELFSADGDFIHDFFDCVFLGPYTRVDMLPCDLNGRLPNCPFYARYCTPLFFVYRTFHRL